MKRFFAWLDRTFIKPVEDSKMSLGTFILIAAGYILVRNLAEGAFESLHILGLATITLHGLEETFLHLMFSWLYLFLVIILLMRLTTGHDIRKITRVLLIYSFIIIIPVIVDPLIRPGGFRLAYPTDITQLPKIVNVIFRPWIFLDPDLFYKFGPQLPYGGSPGMLIEGFLGAILVMVYSGIKAKPNWRKILSVVLTPLVIIGGLTAAGVAQVFMNVIPYYPPASGLDVYHSGGLINSPTRKYVIIILVPFMLLSLLGLWLYNREKFKLLIRSLEPLHLILGGLATLAGFFFARLNLRGILVGVPGNPFDYVALIVLAYLGLCTVALSRFIYKGFDPSSPPDVQKTFRRAAWGMFILAFALAWSVGYSTLFIAVVALFVGALLGLPPLRLGRFLVPSALVKAVSVYLLVFCGYALFATERTFSVVPWRQALGILIAVVGVFLAIELVTRYMIEDKTPAAKQADTKGA
ncbi:hypothetical protein JXM67_14115 [candidate division WOR-3 bacterium]|nr:hypothetical protein [candidate division WOR-3 bacterium]